ncbi:MAG: hypothetical protein MK212_03860, partial [Saprospiraceae bacterium]|nr:hypothetical protein [Saprospiraceae bacterium]
EITLSDVPLSPRSFGHLLQQWQKVREETSIILNPEVLCEANLLTKGCLNYPITNYVHLSRWT